MKPRMLREHFRYYKTNKTWIPKKVFKSEKELIEFGFSSHKWHHYICSFCNEIHIARRKER